MKWNQQHQIDLVKSLKSLRKISLKSLMEVKSTQTKLSKAIIGFFRTKTLIFPQTSQWWLRYLFLWMYIYFYRYYAQAIGSWDTIFVSSLQVWEAFELAGIPRNYSITLWFVLKFCVHHTICNWFLLFFLIINVRVLRRNWHDRGQHDRNRYYRNGHQVRLNGRQMVMI